MRAKARRAYPAAGEIPKAASSVGREARRELGLQELKGRGEVMGRVRVGGQGGSVDGRRPRAVAQSPAALGEAGQIHGEGQER